ncbi:D-hexose-6-phosphate mutarotase [Bordetella sp. 15P40C-2]|uniref:D-hexose-6-phosphate mutarotase n=1 Tax=Bordetella sp. 15P40C-2 TaxID=2572246 RepID=UPI0019245392|nr:D-hexose-6-phosphate mutarotase [Bordetella sp. 15P40C-2]
MASKLRAERSGVAIAPCGKLGVPAAAMTQSAATTARAVPSAPLHQRRHMTTPRIEPTTIGGLTAWRVTTRFGGALITRRGAQLLSYTPTGGRPVIWLSEQARYTPNTAIRGGVPVCWPWFGVYDRNPQFVRDCVAAPPGAASHGWVRQVDWDLAEQHTDGDCATLAFTYAAPPGHQPGWNQHALLTLRLRFSDRIEVALSVQNLGASPLSTTLALHTYLAVSDSRHVSVHGLSGLHYLDMVREGEPRQQQGAITFTEETDRIYLNTSAPITLRDPGWQRDIRLLATNSTSTVVWNPGAAKAARLNDMADDAWPRMVCIETARVLDDALTVAPGQSETVAVAISWQPANTAGARS